MSFVQNESFSGEECRKEKLLARGVTNDQ
jgi:hypothetical protein